jgi:hypothetical protein
MQFDSSDATTAANRPYLEISWTSWRVLSYLDLDGDGLSEPLDS